MAKTLLDVIKENQAKSASQAPAAPVDPQSGLLSNLAAQSGKANTGPGSGTTPAMTNLNQKMANQATQNSLDQIKSGVDQNNISTSQEQEKQAVGYQQQQAALDTRQQSQAQDFSNRTASILQDLEQNKGSMSLEEYGQKLEQAKFSAAMSNKDYIAKLQDAGARLRLSDASNFKLASSKEAAENTLAKNADQREFQTIFNTSERDFAQQMAQMGADYAWDIYKKDVEASNNRAILESVVSLGAAGAQKASK